MPTAIAPRRRSREEFESDEDTRSDPVVAEGSKRARPSNSNSVLFPGTTVTNEDHTSSSSMQQETLRVSNSRRKHQPGSIVRVKLVNFVTYTAVEFFPGPSLNMVIGPNGTGKSTLVCAICLGLGWGPQHLGRAKEVSEFVKHGCQEAMIEIELARDGKRFKKNIIIRCTIKRDGNKTVYSVNGKPSTKKSAVDLAKSLSIQIDNLCQFLPQDKVVEFAAMTPVELLRSTQRAVASQEMIEMHENLKSYKSKQKDAQAKVAADQDTLNNLEGRQRIQEADVERMREREEIVKRVERLQIARPFAAYRKIRDVHTEAKNRRKNAQEELTRLENEVEPSLRAVNEKQRYKTDIEVVMKERKTVVSKADEKADQIDREFQSLHEKSVDLEQEMKAEQNGVKKHKQDIARFEGNITRLKKQMEAPPADVDVAMFNEKIREKRRVMDNCEAQIKDIKRGQTETNQRGIEKKHRIQVAEQRLRELDSQVGRQSMKLRSISDQTFRAWEWIQQHQNEFEKHIFGPPVIECSVNDPKYVDHIEALFPKNTLLAFTVQTVNDFQKLSDIMYKTKRLGEVNIKAVKHSLDHFREPFGAEEMKRFGFEGWALKYLNGPDQVLSMLCGDIHLHEAGIGTRDTNPQQVDMLLKTSLGAWVTNKSIYRISRRREYGASATSIMIRDVNRATAWTDQPVDLTAKRELLENIEAWTEEIKTLESEMTEYKTRILGYRESYVQNDQEAKLLASEKAQMQKAIGEFKALPTRLAQEEEKRCAAQESINGVRNRVMDISDKLDAIAMDRARVAIAYTDAVEALRMAHNDVHEAEIMLIEASSDLQSLTNRNRSVKELLDTKRNELAEVVKETEKVRIEARALLDKCTELLRNEDEELLAFWRELPQQQTSEELENEIESEKARLELMHGGDDRVIREYEERQRKIDAVIERLEGWKAAKAELDQKTQELQDQWEPEIDALFKKISDSFSHNMEQISCAGEVGVHKDEDFDQWAIQIRVKFRESEPLTTLDSHRQSGGERAVSTIFYLMSLQSLTRSPFRVVDEINQGMDPRNERLVHKRMVAIACGLSSQPSRSPNVADSGYASGQPTNEEETRDGNLGPRDEDEGVADVDDATTGNGGSQYFLITPKLLHDLEYVRGMQILCIASGEYMPQDQSRVDFQKCVNLMKGLNAGAGDTGLGIGMSNGAEGRVGVAAG